MVKSVEVKDARTVIFHNSRPSADFPSILYDIPIYPAKYYAEAGHEGFGQKPIGNS